MLYHLQAIKKRFGPRTALDIEELTIREGRLYTLTGANGAGKSTLLNILAFLDRPSHGELSFAGERVEWQRGSVGELRRGVTLLHQSPYLFDTSVGANVAFGLRMRGIRGEDRERLVDEALNTVGLPGFRERRVRELSGGEAQRVAMARALALKPRVLLLDEPLVNVDRETAELLDRLIASLPAQGTSVIMSAHETARPARLEGEPIHLVAGRVAEPRPGR